MIYQSIPLSLHIPKIPIVVEEVLKCRMAIIDYKKSI